MKKILRLTALLLALVMCLGMTALAADPISNDTMTVTGKDGSTVTFDSSDASKVNVTYTGSGIQNGEHYLVLVVKGEQTSFEINEDTILYIDQATATADGSISFTVYPSDVQDSVILIYGTDVGGTGTNELIAAIIEAKYIIGDVDADGYVTASDAAVILRVVAGMETLTDTQEAAANVDTDTQVTASDAAKILRVVAGLDSLS